MDRMHSIAFRSRKDALNGCLDLEIRNIDISEPRDGVQKRRLERALREHDASDVGMEIASGIAQEACSSLTSVRDRRDSFLNNFGRSSSAQRWQTLAHAARVLRGVDELCTFSTILWTSSGGRLSAPRGIEKLHAVVSASAEALITSPERS